MKTKEAPRGTTEKSKKAATTPPAATPPEPLQAVGLLGLDELFKGAAIARQQGFKSPSAYFKHLLRAGIARDSAPPPAAGEDIAVTITGDLAALVHEQAKITGIHPADVAEWFCETGANRPLEKGGRMFMEVPEHLRPAIERIAKAGGYKNGANQLALEIQIDDVAFLDAVRISLIRLSQPTRRQIAAIAKAVTEERLRHSEIHADQWTVKNTLTEGSGSRCK